MADINQGDSLSTAISTIQGMGSNEMNQDDLVNLCYVLINADNVASDSGVEGYSDLSTAISALKTAAVTNAFDKTTDDDSNISVNAALSEGEISGSDLEAVLNSIDSALSGKMTSGQETYTSSSQIADAVNSEIGVTDAIENLGDISSDNLDSNVATAITNLQTSIDNLNTSVGDIEDLEVVSQRRLGESASSFTLTSSYTSIISNMLYNKGKDKSVIRIAWEYVSGSVIQLRLNLTYGGTTQQISRTTASNLEEIEIILDDSFDNQVYDVDLEGKYIVASTEIKNVVVNAL